MNSSNKSLVKYYRKLTQYLLFMMIFLVFVNFGKNNPCLIKRSNINSSPARKSENELTNNQ